MGADRQCRTIGGFWVVQVGTEVMGGADGFGKGELKVEEGDGCSLWELGLLGNNTSNYVW